LGHYFWLLDHIPAVKDYVCECKAEGIGVIETAQIHGTYTRAKKKCDEKSGNMLTQPGNLTIQIRCVLK
jgi:hypothetical protein